LVVEQWNLKTKLKLGSFLVVSLIVHKSRNKHDLCFFAVFLTRAQKVETNWYASQAIERVIIDDSTAEFWEIQDSKTHFIF
jgi:hypothetical protein